MDYKKTRMMILWKSSRKILSLLPRMMKRREVAEISSKEKTSSLKSKLRKTKTKMRRKWIKIKRKKLTMNMEVKKILMKNLKMNTVQKRKTYSKTKNQIRKIRKRKRFKSLFTLTMKSSLIYWNKIFMTKAKQKNICLICLGIRDKEEEVISIQEVGAKDREPSEPSSLIN